MKKGIENKTYLSIIDQDKCLFIIEKFGDDNTRLKLQPHELFNHFRTTKIYDTYRQKEDKKEKLEMFIYLDELNLNQYFIIKQFTKLGFNLLNVENTELDEFSTDVNKYKHLLNTKNDLKKIENPHNAIISGYNKDNPYEIILMNEDIMLKIRSINAIFNIHNFDIAEEYNTDDQLEGIQYLFNFLFEKGMIVKSLSQFMLNQFKKFNYEEEVAAIKIKNEDSIIDENYLFKKDYPETKDDIKKMIYSMANYEGYNYLNPNYKGKWTKNITSYDFSKKYASIMFNEFLPYGEPDIYNNINDWKINRDKIKDNENIKNIIVPKVDLFLIKLKNFKLNREEMPIIYNKNSLNEIRLDNGIKHTEKYLKQPKNEDVVVLITWEIFQEYFLVHNNFEYEIMKILTFKASRNRFKKSVKYYQDMLMNANNKIEKQIAKNLNMLFGNFIRKTELETAFAKINKKTGQVEWEHLIVEKSATYNPLGIFIIAHGQADMFKLIRENYTDFEDNITYCNVDGIDFIENGFHKKPFNFFDMQEGEDFHDLIERIDYHNNETSYNFINADFGTLKKKEEWQQIWYESDKIRAGILQDNTKKIIGSGINNKGILTIYDNGFSVRNGFKTIDQTENGATIKYDNYTTYEVRKHINSRIRKKSLLDDEVKFKHYINLINNDKSLQNDITNYYYSRKDKDKALVYFESIRSRLALSMNECSYLARHIIEGLLNRHK